MAPVEIVLQAEILRPLHRAPLPAEPESTTVLTLDTFSRLPEEARIGAETTVIATSFRMLSAQMLDRLCPDCIVAPLFGRDYDAHDLAEMLGAWGYRGRLVVQAPVVPRPSVIVSDLHRASRGLDVAVNMVARA